MKKTKWLTMGTVSTLALTAGTIAPLAQAEPNDPTPNPSVVVEKTTEAPGKTVEAVAPTVEAPAQTVEDTASQEGQLVLEPMIPNTYKAELTLKGDVNILGLTWTEPKELGEDAFKAEYRIEKGGNWGEWEAFELDTESPEGTQATPGTEPVLVTDATRAQVRVTLKDGQELPKNLKILTFDNTDKPKTRGRSRRATFENSTNLSNGVFPLIHSRDEWKPEARYYDWDPVEYGKVKGVIIHHTASSNDYTAAQVPDVIRGIYRFHAHGRHWGDIGYNVLVDKYGNAWQGRNGDVTKLPQGAHAYGANMQTFGISVIGNYDKQAPRPEVLRTVAQIAGWKLTQNNLDPHGKMVLTGTLRGYKTPLTTDVISGHRQVGATDCPGDAFFAKLPEVRNLAAQYQNNLKNGVAPWINTGHTLGDYIRKNPKLDPKFMVVADPDIYQAWVEAKGAQGAWGAPVGGLDRSGMRLTQRFTNGVAERQSRGTVVFTFNEELNKRPSLPKPPVSPKPSPKPDPNTSVVRGIRISGPIRDKWLALGGERAAVGSPIAPQRSSAGGVLQSFDRWDIFYKSGAGAHFVNRGGAIRAEWARHGLEKGKFGYPLSDERRVRNGVWNQDFEGGTIFFANGRTVALYGPIRDRWLSLGGAKSSAGIPVGSQVSSNGGVYQYFDRWDIYSKAGIGTHFVNHRGAIRAEWARNGLEKGKYGYPISDEKRESYGWSQDFEGGTIRIKR
ncbi:hypothetical protein BSR28_02220 [Boudabousia liubingyangii]|uniref:N-acetylmuramoyl-L-alanine amidase n=1 Tax=Boudabousia liubingyangii TaxID=1921764 RepID=UPI000938B712|nr:N-acetylmuramoyl-L-alanine amidase [Boudabousia liubingyangii]OKL48525.1 hypothetical protein BSR28_02220 [Boudabousia liubingyangii]